MYGAGALPRGTLGTHAGELVSVSAIFLTQFFLAQAAHALLPVCLGAKMFFHTLAQVQPWVGE